MTKSTYRLLFLWCKPLDLQIHIINVYKIKPMDISKSLLKSCVPIVLKNLRKNKGITQQTLADFLQVSKVHVSALETGKKLPNLLMIYRISEVLGVKADETIKMLSKEIDSFSKT